MLFLFFDFVIKLGLILLLKFFEWILYEFYLSLWAVHFIYCWCFLFSYNEDVREIIFILEVFIIELDFTFICHKSPLLVIVSNCKISYFTIWIWDNCNNKIHENHKQTEIAQNEDNESEINSPFLIFVNDLSINIWIIIFMMLIEGLIWINDSKISKCTS